MKQSLCIFLLIAGTASADELQIIPLVDVDPQQLAPSSRSGTLPAKDESRGSAFSTSYRTRLEYVGWYDSDRDGLSHSHRVGIWRDTPAHRFGLILR